MTTTAATATPTRLQTFTRSATARGAVLGVAVAVVSAIPLFRLDIDTGSKVALSSMHLLTGAAAIAAQVITQRGSDSAMLPSRRTRRPS